MAKGKTVSVTIPQKVVEFYEKKAEELGTSRSSILGNVILADYEKKSQERITNVSTGTIQTEDTQ